MTLFDIAIRVIAKARQSIISVVVYDYVNNTDEICYPSEEIFEEVEKILAAFEEVDDPENDVSRFVSSDGAFVTCSIMEAIRFFPR